MYFDDLRRVLGVIQLKTAFKHPEFTNWISTTSLSALSPCLTFWAGLLGPGLMVPATHSPDIIKLNTCPFGYNRLVAIRTVACAYV